MIGWLALALLLVGIVLVAWGCHHSSGHFAMPDPITTIAGLTCLVIGLLLGAGWAIYRAFFGG
ncbi:MAG: hypothetical protein HYU77_13780 [Betaproteobacteria bacterium]|nr:hypothetical protein [Betaproteobacteria bacterium]